MFGLFSKNDNLENTIMKYDLEEYFGIGIQTKVVDFEL